jgi:hypothetical protein
MQVIWQDTDSHGLERAALLHQLVDAPQMIDPPHEQIARSICKRYREKEGATLNN